MKKITYKLSTPIDAHGETLSQIELREPLAADVIKSGMPYQMAYGSSGNSSLIIDSPACARLISGLAGIPTSSIGQMSLADFSDLQQLVIGYFVPSGGTQTEDEGARPVEAGGAA